MLSLVYLRTSATSWTMKRDPELVTLSILSDYFYLNKDTFAHVLKISNNALYAKTAQCPISAVCRRQRLLRFGHVIREGKDAVSYKALHMAMNITDIKKPRGRPVTKWVDNIRNDLLLLNMSLLEAEQLASDRTHWLDVVDRCITLIWFFTWAICVLYYYFYYYVLRSIQSTHSVHDQQKSNCSICGIGEAWAVSKSWTLSLSYLPVARKALL